MVEPDEVSAIRRCISLRLRCARMARRSCPCVNSGRDAVTQRDVVTSFRFRTVTGLLEARRFDVEILDRREWPSPRLLFCY